MEQVSVFCLSLLLCALSGAELQDSEITEQSKLSPESVNVLDQAQFCLSDLHSVLQAMSIKLAENRLMIQQLQTLNQEQNAKLAENEAGIKQQQTLNQEQNAKLAKCEVGIQQLHNLNQEQAAKLKDLKTQVDTQQQVGRVAFSASLLASGHGYTGPFNTHTPLVFRHVVSNIGSAYNPNTGFFTVTVRGAYHFEFYIATYGGPPGAVAVLVKNGQQVLTAQENTSNLISTGANGATLLLEAGDVVSLRLFQGYRIYDDGSHYSTFSGHLLFTM